MNTSKIIVLLAIVLLASCGDVFDPIQDLQGTRSDIRAMLSSEDVRQTTSLPADNFNFVSRAGVIVTAHTNAFVYKDDGTVVTGMIDFEMTELFTKSEILMHGIQTQTLYGEILESDGEFLFEASQDGRDIILSDNGQLLLTVPNQAPNPEMQLFQQVEGLWVPDALSELLLIERPDSSSVGPGYLAFLGGIDWVNIDYFTKFDNELSTAEVCLPDGYSKDNTLLWVVFKNLDVVLSPWGDFPMTIEGLPVGEEVFFIAISAEDSGNFRLDIKEEMITAGMKVNLEPEKISEEDLKKRLKELD